MREAHGGPLSAGSVNCRVKNIHRSQNGDETRCCYQGAKVIFDRGRAMWPSTGVAKAKNSIGEEFATNVR